MMQMQFSGDACWQETAKALTQYDAVVLPVLASGEMGTAPTEYKAIYTSLAQCAKERLKKEGVLVLTLPAAPSQQVVLVQFSEPEPDCKSIRFTYAKAVCEIASASPKNFAVSVAERFSPMQAACALEAVVLASYRFDKYRSTPSSFKDAVCTFLYRHGDDPLLQRAYVRAKATLFARDMVNEPSNVLTPEKTARLAEEAGRRHGFSCKVIEGKELEQLDMKAFLTVARGSAQPPRLIVMEYKNRLESSERVALVGKGLTFDSGGYSIKPTDSMLTMKSDMGGAAAVIGAMCAIAENKVKANVVGIVAACENMISGAAYRPGDIVPTLNGKYVEIANTDAEGRLTLADAVSYAIREQKATQIIDIATLTGAAMIALGDKITAVLTDSEQLWEGIQKASDHSGEKVWRLPCDEELKTQNHSDIADLKNTGGRYGGCITAGLFVHEFAEGLPWLHLDIAGPSWCYSDTPLCPKGATGAGVRLLSELIENGINW